MLSIINRSFASVKNKIEKIKPPAVEGFFNRLLNHTQTSMTYPLLYELFGFLDQSNILKQEFPLIKSNIRFQTNFMLLNAYIMYARLVAHLLKQREQAKMPRSELDKYIYNMKTYYFVPFAKKVQTHIPVTEFGVHFVENYTKRFEILSNQLDQLPELQMNQQNMGKLCDSLNKVVYQGKTRPEDPQVKKLVKYYLAHRKYLSSIYLEDLVKYKIDWGLDRIVYQIDQ